MPTEFHRFWSFGYRDIRGGGIHPPPTPGCEMGPKSPALLGLRRLKMLGQVVCMVHNGKDFRRPVSYEDNRANGIALTVKLFTQSANGNYKNDVQEINIKKIGQYLPCYPQSWCSKWGIWIRHMYLRRVGQRYWQIVPKFFRNPVSEKGSSPAAEWRWDKTDNCGANIGKRWQAAVY